MLPEHVVDVGFFRSSFAFASMMLCSAWRVAFSTSLPASAASTKRRIFSSKSSPVLVIINAGRFEQRLDVADGVRRHLQFFHQPADDVFLEGTLQYDVQDADAGMLRSKPLDAPDALFDDHRIPGQIIVHQHIGDLKIDALRSCFRGDDHVALGRILPETRDGVLVALARRRH